jgi:hypothetical protein
MTPDYWWLAAPLAGSAANLIAQVAFARILSGERLVLVIIAAFCAGLVATGATIGFALSRTELPASDVLGLAASVVIIYFAAGFVLFAIVNLGETSLRIRMMRVLLDSPGGITRDKLLASYDDRALITVRLQRLRDNRQARVVDEIYYSRPSFLFFACAGIRLLQRIVYGKR